MPRQNAPPMNEKPAAPLGGRMRAARHARGLTQKELAQALDVREKDIGRWENGGHLPSAARLPEIAAALEVSLDWLFGLDD